MKKLLTSLLCILLLAACSSNEVKNEPAEAENPTSESTPSNDATNELDTDAAEEEPADSEFASYEEYDTIASFIDLKSNIGTVETDNEGNRIILFESTEGKKTFKSIFAKHDRFLKIIDLSNDQLLFKDQIN
ncbi:PBP1b-binding outer membrane lipoprotein LpoB [Sporosarcina luteola]|nr:PBP1b-binding outer membrane lipoprotein LpoB [Sporosarcina luteola]